MTVRVAGAVASVFGTTGGSRRPAAAQPAAEPGNSGSEVIDDAHLQPHWARFGEADDADAGDRTDGPADAAIELADAMSKGWRRSADLAEQAYRALSEDLAADRQPARTGIEGTQDIDDAYVRNPWAGIEEADDADARAADWLGGRDEADEEAEDGTHGPAYEVPGLADAMFEGWSQSEGLTEQAYRAPRKDVPNIRNVRGGFGRPDGSSPHVQPLADAIGGDQRPARTDAEVGQAPPSEAPTSSVEAALSEEPVFSGETAVSAPGRQGTDLSGETAVSAPGRPGESPRRGAQDNTGRPTRSGLTIGGLPLAWLMLPNPRLGGVPGAADRPTGDAGARTNGKGRRAWRNVAVRLAGVFTSFSRRAGGSRRGGAVPSAAEPGVGVTPRELSVRGNTAELTFDTDASHLGSEARSIIRNLAESYVNRQPIFTMAAFSASPVRFTVSDSSYRAVTIYRKRMDAIRTAFHEELVGLLMTKGQMAGWEAARIAETVPVRLDPIGRWETPSYLDPGDRRARIEVDDWLVIEVNNRLRAEHGWDPAAGVEPADREEIEAALWELPQGGPSDRRGMAHDLASKIATGAVRRERGGGTGLEAEFPSEVELREGADRLEFRIQARDGGLSVGLDRMVRNVTADTTPDQIAQALIEHGSDRGDPVNVLENATAPITAVPGLPVELNMPWLNPTAGRTPDHIMRALIERGLERGEPYVVNVLEIATAPIMAVPGDEGRANGEDVLAALERVYRRLEQLEGRDRRRAAITEIFPEDSFEYSPDAEGAHVSPGPDGLRFDLLVHFTAGVPITRMHEFLSEARDHTAPQESAREHLADGLQFGNEIAAMYVETLPEHEGHQIPAYAAHLFAGHEDVSALRGFMSLVYAQIAPIVHGEPGMYVRVKARAAAVSRTSLAGIRRTLPEPVKDFLESETEEIEAALVKMLQYRMPELDDTDPLSQQGLWDSEGDYLIGNYLDTALDPDVEEIDQNQALGVHTHFDEPDTNDGRLELPLVLVELRKLGGLGPRRQTMEDLKRHHAMVDSMAKRTYAEALAFKETPIIDVNRQATTATPADLTRFQDAISQGIGWVQGIESVLTTAWSVDPVLRGEAGKDAFITEERVDRIVSATSAVLRGDHSPVERLAADLSAIHDGLVDRVDDLAPEDEDEDDLDPEDEDTLEEVGLALEAARNAITQLRRLESSARPGALVERGDVLTGQVPVERDGGRFSAPADPATRRPGDIRPVEGARPPGKGKGAEIRHTFERPVTGVSAAHPPESGGQVMGLPLTVAEPGDLAQDIPRSSPTVDAAHTLWQEQTESARSDFNHATDAFFDAQLGLPDLAETAAREYAAAYQRAQELFQRAQDDTGYEDLHPDLRPQQRIDDMRQAARDITDLTRRVRSRSAEDVINLRQAESSTRPGTFAEPGQGLVTAPASRPADSSPGTPEELAGHLSLDEKMALAPLIESSYGVRRDDSGAASVESLEEALIEAGPGSISLVVTSNAAGNRLVAANLEGQVTWVEYPSGRPAARPVNTMVRSLELGSDGMVLDPSHELRQLDPDHAVFEFFQGLQATLTDFLDPASPEHSRAATPAPAPQEASTPAERLRGGAGESSGLSRSALKIYQKLTALGSVPPSQNGGWRRPSKSVGQYCVEVAVAQAGIWP